jgi:2-phosphoglycolate phosphatase
MFHYRAVIFDLDGTLVDSFGPITESVNVVRSAGSKRPLTIDEVRAHVGHGLEALLQDLAPGVPAEAAVKLFRDHYETVFLDGTRLIEGASEAISVLAARGVRLAVASNKPKRFTGRIVRGLGLSPPVEFVIGPGPAVPPKPEPVMLRAACERLGESASDCLYVGDMPLDVESARRAGLDHVLVAGGAHSAARLRSIPGARVLDHISELSEVCGEQLRTSSEGKDTLVP